MPTEPVLAGVSSTFSAPTVPPIPASAPAPVKGLRGPVADRRWPIAILGVPIDAVTMDEALERIRAMVESRRPHYVVTPNVDFLVQAREDKQLHQILLNADLVLCDGQPLVWASKWLGNPLPERVAGADLTPRLIAQAAKLGHGIFLLGATPEANDLAARHLSGAYPGLRIAGAYSPPFKPLAQMNNAEIVAKIRAAKPDILFVSFGCPKQEKWIAMHYRELGVPVCLGVGATIDFLAGTVRRAPTWMRRSGLEWTYRLAQEPRRLFRRYAKDMRHFGGALLAQWWRLRPGRSATTGAVAITRRSQPWQEVCATGVLDRAVIERTADIWHGIVQDDRDCRLDLERVDFIDSTAAAVLAVWQRRLRGAGRRLVLVRPSDAVVRLLRWAGMNGLEVAENPRRLAA
jgi:N-acetylglucosaminyldiphosphoundecaprenol N-acetyl-beta-D-mannosaminyltransferase